MSIITIVVASAYINHMSNFNFGNISTSSKKSAINLKGIQNVVLMDKSSYSASYDFVITILADEAYSPFQVKAIDKMLKRAGITKYIMLSTLNCSITKEEIAKTQKGGITRLIGQTMKSIFLSILLSLR